MQEFTTELKALIIKHGLSFAQVNQALAIISNELEEKKRKVMLEGKK